jgi:uncharacterized protein (TIGR02118 family)
MVRLTILYGQPTDPQAFDEYYERVHIPLARKMRGWTRWTLEKVVPSPGDPPPPYYLIVGLYAPSMEEARRILATPESQAAAADVANFATGGSTSLFTEVTDVDFDQ